MVDIHCDGRSVREINADIKSLIAGGEREIRVKNPGARHNLGVAVLQPVKLTFEGSVGYYCGGMGDGATIEIVGSAGWGLAESMMSGTVIVRGNAGNGAAAAVRGGTIVIEGDAAARAGVSLKGGVVLIDGDCGYMAGFMAQKGVLVVCGNAGEAFADSMYEAVCFVGREIASLGNDAVVEPLTSDDRSFLDDMFSRYLGNGLGTRPSSASFKKVVAGKKLWNFSKAEWSTWREAL